MLYIYTLASLNINGIANDTRNRMLEYFLWTNDIDIALLQEVTSPHLDSIRRYTKHKYWDRKTGHGNPDQRWPHTYGRQVPTIWKGNCRNVQRDMPGKQIWPLGS